MYGSTSDSDCMDLFADTSSLVSSYCCDDGNKGRIPMAWHASHVDDSMEPSSLEQLFTPQIVNLSPQRRPGSHHHNDPERVQLSVVVVPWRSSTHCTPI
jgi:hypothetical protein